MKLIIRILASIVIWVLVALLMEFLGGLVVTVKQEQIKYLGEFVQAKSALLGFLAGLAYFIWGKYPPRAA